MSQPTATAARALHANPSPGAAATAAPSRRRTARALVPPLSPETAQALAETFRVLGDPTRIRLIAAMAVAERCVGDLASLVSMSGPRCRTAADAAGGRLVRTRRAGRQVFYTLDDGHILALFEQGLSHVHEPHGGLRRGEHGDER